MISRRTVLGLGTLAVLLAACGKRAALRPLTAEEEAARAAGQPLPTRSTTPPPEAPQRGGTIQGEDPEDVGGL
ncbi:MAG: hypothetical protein ACFB3T_15020 [Geminicoccaceae bacterium]